MKTPRYLRGAYKSKTSPGALFLWEAWLVILMQI